MHSRAMSWRSAPSGFGCSSSDGAIYAGLAVVYVDDIWVVAVAATFCLVTSLHFLDDLEAVEGQHRREHLADMISVVHHHHPDGPPHWPRSLPSAHSDRARHS